MEIAELYEMAEELRRRDDYVCKLMGDRLHLLAGRLDAMVTPNREPIAEARTSRAEFVPDQEPSPGPQK